MTDTTKIGIIICDRYRECAGGKCFRSLRNREGAFSRYRDTVVEVVGYTTCGGCPGGNVEYAPSEMLKNGAEIVHFATGAVVGYPPCPYVHYFKQFIRRKFDMDVVIGTHPIPQDYFETHRELNTWETPEWREVIQETLADEETRRAYD